MENEDLNNYVALTLLAETGWAILSNVVSRPGNHENLLPHIERILLGFGESSSPSNVLELLRHGQDVTDWFGDEVKQRVTSIFCRQQIISFESKFTSPIQVTTVEERLRYLVTVIKEYDTLFPAGWNTVGEFVEQACAVIRDQLKFSLSNSPVSDPGQFFLTWKKCVKFERHVQTYTKFTGRWRPISRCFEGCKQLIQFEDQTLRDRVTESTQKDAFKGDSANILDSSQQIFCVVKGRLDDYCNLLSDQSSSENNTIIRVQLSWRKHITYYCVRLLGALGNMWNWYQIDEGKKKSKDMKDVPNNATQLQALLTLNNTSEWWCGLLKSIEDEVERCFGTTCVVDMACVKESFRLLQSKTLECIYAGIFGCLKSEIDTFGNINWSGEKVKGLLSLTRKPLGQKTHDGISELILEMEDKIRLVWKTLTPVMCSICPSHVWSIFHKFNDFIGEKLMSSLQSSKHTFSQESKTQLLNDMVHMRTFLSNLPDMTVEESMMKIPGKSRGASITRFQLESMEKPFLPLDFLDLLLVPLEEFPVQYCELDCSKVVVKKVLRLRGCSEDEVEVQAARVKTYQKVLHDAQSDLESLPLTGGSEVEDELSILVETVESIGSRRAHFCEYTLEEVNNSEYKYRILFSGEVIAQFKRPQVFGRVCRLIKQSLAGTDDDLAKRPRKCSGSPLLA